MSTRVITAPHPARCAGAGTPSFGTAPAGADAPHIAADPDNRIHPAHVLVPLVGDLGGLPGRRRRPDAAALAATDALTGALSAHEWHLRLPAMVAAGPTWVVVLGVDGLPRVVARDGNRAADRILAATAAEWTTALRGGDVLARVAGDAFAAGVRAGELATALRVSERLRAAAPEGVACSVAVLAPGAEEDAAAITARGLDALAAARRAGGERTAVLLGR